MLAGLHPILAYFVLVAVIGLVAGVLIYLIRRAPVIPDMIKQLGEWFILVVAVIFLLVKGLALLGIG